MLDFTKLGFMSDLKITKSLIILLYKLSDFYILVAQYGIRFSCMLNILLIYQE